MVEQGMDGGLAKLLRILSTTPWYQPFITAKVDQRETVLKVRSLTAAPKNILVILWVATEILLRHP